jgi:hypothetical protein
MPYKAYVKACSDCRGTDMKVFPNGKKIWRAELHRQQPDGDRMVVFGMGRCPDNRAFRKWAGEACGSLGEDAVKEAFLAAPEAAAADSAS